MCKVEKSTPFGWYCADYEVKDITSNLSDFKVVSDRSASVSQRLVCGGAKHEDNTS